MAYTDMERRILDMWPKYEDGSYVMYEDEFDFNGDAKTAYGFNFGVGGRVSICSDKGSHVRLPNGEHVKRPAPKVLDADGVEIRVGDTVYEPRMFGDNSFTVSRFTKNRDGKTFVMVEEMGGGLFPETVTHIRPDSWERLERDADNGPCGYFGFNGKKCTGCPAFDKGKSCIDAVCTDIVRRAKALAEKEAER